MINNLFLESTLCFLPWINRGTRARGIKQLDYADENSILSLLIYESSYDAPAADKEKYEIYVEREGQARCRLEIEELPRPLTIYILRISTLLTNLALIYHVFCLIMLIVGSATLEATGIAVLVHELQRAYVASTLTSCKVCIEI